LSRIPEMVSMEPPLLCVGIRHRGIAAVESAT
jgi:hypothetical protein